MPWLAQVSRKWWPTATHRVHQEKAEVQTLFGSHGGRDAPLRNHHARQRDVQRNETLIKPMISTETELFPIPLPCARFGRSARPCRVTSDQSSCVCAGRSAAPRPSMTGAAVATGDTTLMSVEDTQRPTAVFFSMELQRRPARAGLAVVQEPWRRRLPRLHGHRQRNDLWAALAGTLRSSCGGICRIPRMLQFRVLHSFALYLQ